MMENGVQEISQTQGVVKWFDPRKGYGFIVGPDGADVFVHYSQIEGDGFRALNDGGSVTYDAVRTERGWHATRVVRSEPAEVHVLRRTHTRSPRR